MSKSSIQDLMCLFFYITIWFMLIKFVNNRFPIPTVILPYKGTYKLTLFNVHFYSESAFCLSWAEISISQNVNVTFNYKNYSFIFKSLIFNEKIMSWIPFWYVSPNLVFGEHSVNRETLQYSSNIQPTTLHNHSLTTSVSKQSLTHHLKIDSLVSFYFW